MSVEGGAEARRIVIAAEADRTQRTRRSEAERDAFLLRRAAHDAAPGVFRSRYRLGVVRDALEKARRYIVAARPDREVIRLDFDERVPSGLFDTSPPATEEP